MKKILIVTLEYPPQIGGVASYITNFAAHYTDQEFIVYAPKISDHDESYDAAHPWRVIRKKQLLRWWWPRWLAMLWQCYVIVRRERITDLHIHHVLPGGYVGLFLKKVCGIRYTIFLHGTDAIHGQRPQKINQLRFVLQHADAIVVNSTYLQGVVEKIAPKAVPSRVINPCPSNFFIESTPSEGDITFLRERLALHSKRVILSVGRLVEGKGYRQLLELFPRLLSRFPNLTWVIVGTGPLEHAIVERARELQVASALRFIGVVPPERLRLFYALADIFVLLTHKTSRSTEAWGTVFLEAAAAGIPVIAGRGGGVEEAVCHGVTGMVVDTEHPQEIVTSICNLLEHPEEARRLGKAGQERIRESFTWEKQLSRLSS